MANKKLVKIKEGAKVSGVCLGLSKYFGIDVVYIRLIFVLAALFGWGAPILIYIALAIVLPEYDPDAVEFHDVYDDEDVPYTSTSHKFSDEYDDSSRYERGEDRYRRKDEETYKRDDEEAYNRKE
jgi:phage shock protein PspC (stress-responsive transcriptional regulator)